jgi:hypothetical protein
VPLSVRVVAALYHQDLRHHRIAAMLADQHQPVYRGFSANTPKGEDWMAETEITMPISEAKECIEAARSAGLVVAMFA